MPRITSDLREIQIVGRLHQRRGPKPGIGPIRHRFPSQGQGIQSRAEKRLRGVRHSGHARSGILIVTRRIRTSEANSSRRSRTKRHGGAPPVVEDGRSRAAKHRSSFDTVMNHPKIRRVHAVLIAVTLIGAVAALIRIDPGGRAAVARSSNDAPINSQPTPTKPAAKVPAVKKGAGGLYSFEGGGHTSSGSSVPRL